MLRAPFPKPCTWSDYGSEVSFVNNYCGGFRSFFSDAGGNKICHSIKSCWSVRDYGCNQYCAADEYLGVKHV